MLDSGKCLSRRAVILTSWRRLCFICICKTTLSPPGPPHCKDAQSPGVVSLCAGAPPSPPYGWNAAVRRLVHSRNLREEPDRWPCADSRSPEWRRAGAAVGVLVDYACPTSKSSTSSRPLFSSCTLNNWYWEHTTGGEAGDDELEIQRQSARGGGVSVVGGDLVSQTTLKTCVLPSRFCKSTLLNAQVVWTPSAQMRHNSVSPRASP